MLHAIRIRIDDPSNTLCQPLHLGDWDDAATLANGLLAMPITATDGVGFCTAPLVRIEAWQLVAKCSGQRGDTAGACNALESAASESLAVGYIFTEMVSLRAMLQWVESDFLGSTDLPGSVEEKSASLRIQARIDIVATKFVSCGVSQYDSSAA